jgi:hypothetical protein
MPRLWWILVTLLMIAFANPIWAQETGGTVIIRGPRADNVYAAGGTVDVLGDLERDLVAAGGSVNVLGRVQRDVVVAGGSVTLTGRVGDDVRVAGGIVTIGSDVGGEVVAAGGTVILAPEAGVAGRAWLAGRRVEVGGRVGRGLKVAAQTARISGQVQGDLHIVGRRIEIGPTARITGNLVYTSPQDATIAPTARIGGTVRHTRSDLAARARRVGRLVLGIGRVVILLGLTLAGLVLLLVFPNFTFSAERTIAQEPWTSLGLGVALLVGVPLGAMLLMISLVGLPIGLTILAAYAVSLLLGYLTAAGFLGTLADRTLRRAPGPSVGQRWLFLTLALIVLALLRMIPVVGGLACLLALVFGLGAWTREAYRRYAGERTNG